MVIDVSSNQGKINWQKVKAAGVTEVIIRTTMGTGTVDKMAHEYATEATAVGITVSYYAFGYPDKKHGGTAKADAESEAQWFCDTIKGLPTTYKYLVIDLEEATTLTPQEFTVWATAWRDKVQSITGIANENLWVYGYYDYLNRNLINGHTLGRNPLWIAAYTQAQPHIPHGWTKWNMWQYDNK
jgi:lysozyme